MCHAEYSQEYHEEISGTLKLFKVATYDILYFSELNHFFNKYCYILFTLPAK